MARSLLGSLTAPVRARLGRLTVEEFRDRFLAASRAAYPSLVFTPLGEDLVEAEEPDGVFRTTVLNAYRAYQQEPGALDAIIAQLVRMREDDLSDAPIGLDELLLILRPSEIYGVAPEEERDEHPLSRAFAGELRAYLVRDRQEIVAFPPSRVVRDDTGLSDDALWTQAASNTAERALGAEVVLTKENLVWAAAGLNVSSCLLLDEAFLQRPEVLSLGPSPVAIVGKHLVILGPSDDAELVSRMRLTTQTQDDWLSEEVYQRTGAGWAVLDGR